MTPKRLALGLLAIISGLAGLYVATTDVHYQDRNCGTALFRVDISRLSVQSGDLEADEFEEQSLITNCDQLILRQRFLAAAPTAVMVASIVAGRRLRGRHTDSSDTFGSVRRAV